MSSKDAKPNPAAQALERLIEAQRVGQALFEREAGRMAAKHGLADPRTQRMIRTAGGARDTLNALEIAQDSQPQEVAAGKGEAVIYGRVAADDLRGVSRATVMIEDTAGRVQRAAGSAVTDAAGRYALRVAPAVAEKLAGREYIVVVEGAKGEVLHRASDTLKLAVDQAVRADFNVGARPPIAAPQPKTPKPDKPREPVVFKVVGTLASADGKPVSGMLVRVFDKDVRYDDLLGAAMTGRKGTFVVSYRLQDFSEGETAADLYFVVSDAQGKERLSTADHVIFNADRETRVELVLKG